MFDNVPPILEFSSDEWVAATSQLMVLLERGEHHLNLLLEAAQNEYLSAAFDIAVFDVSCTGVVSQPSSFSLAIERALPQAFAKNIDAYISDAAARGFPLELVSPIYASEEGKQFGILPPVLSSLARRFASAAVVGLCEATYTKQAAKVLFQFLCSIFLVQMIRKMRDAGVASRCVARNLGCFETFV